MKLAFIYCAYGILLQLLSASTIYSQDIIYKKNGFGEIEIYTSAYGVPQGEPLGRVKKNGYGYIEVEDLSHSNYFKQTSEDFGYKPHLIAIKPSLAPVAEILNTANTYFQLLRNQQDKQSGRTAEVQKNYAAITELFTPFQARAKSLKQFLTSYANVPETVQNGWHNVLIISKLENLKRLLPDALKGVDSIGALGYGLVQNNRLVLFLEQEYDDRQYIFHSGKNYVTGSINKCDAIVKEDDKILEVLFVDYAIDPKPIAEKPKMGGVTFNYPNQQMPVEIDIYDSQTNKAAGFLFFSQDQGSNYFLGLPGAYNYVVKKLDQSKAIITQGSFTLQDAQDLKISL